MKELCKARKCDIKDKDDFLQKVVKARNALKTEVSALKQNLTKILTLGLKCSEMVMKGNIS